MKTQLGTDMLSDFSRSALDEIRAETLRRSQWLSNASKDGIGASDDYRADAERFKAVAEALRKLYED